MSSTRRAAAEARALHLALVLAAKAGWRFDRGPLPHSSFTHFLYVEMAQLLLVPTTAGPEFAVRQVEPVVRETRSDALIVSLPDQAAPVFAFATWARHETVWTTPLVLWLTETGEPWLVPAAAEGTPLGFRLGNALHHAAPVPWASAFERAAGIGRAAAWMETVTQVVTR